jgi:hypothetical protein
MTDDDLRAFAHDNGSRPAHENNHVLDLSHIWHADAIPAGTLLPRHSSEERSGLSVAREGRKTPPEDSECSLPLVARAGRIEGLNPRQSTIVYLAVLLRIVPYQELRHLLFRHQCDAQVRKAVLGLDREGWVHRWNAPIPGVGRHGHIHPTARALQATLPRLAIATRAEPWSPLIREMLPRFPRSALQLGRQRPKWYVHQREANEVAIAALRAVPVRWISAWDAPFPAARIGSVDLPQPDYVLVMETPHGPELVFGEHDRGTEPPSRFRERKLRAYARLAGRAESLLGMRAFRVHVSVSESAPRGAVHRLLELTRETRVFGADAMFRFTIAPRVSGLGRMPAWYHAARVDVLVREYEGARPS